MAFRQALIVVDVQDGISNSIDGVPDADKIVPAIDSILRLTRLYNDLGIRGPESKDKVEIVFVQHDDKDPEDPLHRGKPTWELIFQPREKAKNERLVSKDVGEYKRGFH
jgi:nicotinamidase-related amidase